VSSGPPLVVGLIVNPIAGMGGRVGLKGTDGDEALARARALGAEPVAPARADAVAARLVAAGVEVRRVAPASAAGTREAAADLSSGGIPLLLFVGGDGTARDVCAAVGTSVVALGVPAGVKMHSGVFATSPGAAADAAITWLRSSARSTREADVVDVDEAAMREGRMEVRVFGELRVPDVPGRVQSPKASGGAASSAGELAALAAEVVRRLPSGLVVLGPGTTTRAVGAALGVQTTLLGIDVVRVGGTAANVVASVVAADAGERDILAALDGQPAVAVVSPTGGQGFLLGRGNQQLSPAVLRAVGPGNVVIVATNAKLAALGGRPLYVDTGDASLDGALAGHRRAITGPGRESVVRVEVA
jgi:predicted polyphosphate/ATP-dependent NAD kinase